MQNILTPESTNIVELHTNIFRWYARFDVVIGMVAGTEALLPREWYIGKETYDAEQAAVYPNDHAKQLALVASINRRCLQEMASLYARFSDDVISLDQFIVQN